MLIFGSTAAKHWLPSFREPKDLDVLGQGPSRPNVEYHWCPEMQYIVDNNKDSVYVDLDFLYTIKVSHSAWPLRKWDRHLMDVVTMRKAGARLDERLHKALFKRWEQMHGSKAHIRFTASKDFFTPRVSRQVEHDWLHEQLALTDRPMHEKIRKSEDSTYCSRELFENLSPQEQIYTALEEVYVIATERYDAGPGAKYKAYRDLVTKMTKGWFNVFLIENVDRLLRGSKEEDKLWTCKLHEISWLKRRANSAKVMRS